MNVAEDTLDLVAQAAETFTRADAQRGKRPDDSWSAFAEQGWLGVLVPEALGGTGLGVKAAAIIAQRLGHACFTDPYVAGAVVAVRALTGCAASPLRDETIAALVAGTKRIALASADAVGARSEEGPAVRAEQTARGATLRGSLRFVVPARADAYLVAATATTATTGTSASDAEPSLHLVAAHTRGLTVVEETNADGTTSGWLKLEGVEVEEPTRFARGAAAERAVDDALAAGIVCTAAELLGLIERSLELTKTYLETRQQFGQPIGAFQVLQHRAVDMWIQKELTRGALRSALTVLDDDGSSVSALRAAASSVKARASQAGLLVAEQALQLHGAIGFSAEYALGAYVNRTLTLAPRYGNASFHRRRYGALVTVEEH